MKGLGIGLLLAIGIPAFAADDANAAAIQKGKQVYEYWCATCHGPNLAGTVALQTKYNGSKPALLVDRTDLLPAMTKTFVRKGVTIMPFFRKTEISDADLDALAAYFARNSGSAAGRPAQK
jgi:mono/diheme cytochrome c family protein